MKAPPTRVFLGCVAGALSVLVFHQTTLQIFYWLGWAPLAAFRTAQQTRPGTSGQRRTDWTRRPGSAGRHVGGELLALVRVVEASEVVRCKRISAMLRICLPEAICKVSGIGLAA